MCSVAFFDNGPKIEIPRVKSKPATGSKAKSDKKAVSAQLTSAVNQIEDVLSKPHTFDYGVVRDDVMQVSAQLAGKSLLNQAEMDVLLK